MAKTFQREKKQKNKKNNKKEKKKRRGKTHKNTPNKKKLKKTKKTTTTTQYGQNAVVCFIQPFFQGARCSFMVSAFGYGAMGRRIDPSWVAISRSSHCSKTGVTNTVVCDTLYVGRCI